MNQIDFFSKQHNLHVANLDSGLTGFRGRRIEEITESIAHEAYLNAVEIMLPYSVSFRLNGQLVHSVDSSSLREDGVETTEEWGFQRNALVFYTNAAALYDLNIDSEFDYSKIFTSRQRISINGAMWTGMNVSYDDQDFALRSYYNEDEQRELIEPGIDEAFLIESNGSKFALGFISQETFISSTNQRDLTKRMRTTKKRPKNSRA